MNAVSSARRRVAAWRPRIVVVHGAIGIGNARLVEEHLPWATRPTVRSRWLFGYSTDGCPAYAAYMAWLRWTPGWVAADPRLSNLARLIAGTVAGRPELTPPEPWTEVLPGSLLAAALWRKSVSNRWFVVGMVPGLPRRCKPKGYPVRFLLPGAESAAGWSLRRAQRSRAAGQTLA